MQGKTLAHYELGEKIGEGGMGQVYRARDPQLGREVAIKILPDLFANDPERLQRFEREARLLASLNHPGIAAVYGLHEDRGTRFLAMELVPGHDLAKQLTLGKVSWEEALPILHQLTAALEAAHEQSVVHRDLKPSNVMLTPDGVVKVLDFGLARSVETSPDASQLTQSPTLLSAATMQGVILGTAAYMAPEQARGKRVDRRADIWAFGVIAFEMLSGRQLFSGETVSDTMAEVLKSELPWEALPSETPPAMLALLKRCLDRDPKSRLRDIGEARIVLERIQAGDPGMAASAASGSWVSRFGGWIAAALVAVASVAILSLNGGNGPPAESAEELRKWAIPMSSDDANMAQNFNPALSPDGRHLAYVSNNMLHVRDFDSLEPRVLAGTEGALIPFWSPDGEWIGFGRDNSIHKLPAAGGSVSLLATLPATDNVDGSSGNAVWTPDGRIFFTSGNSGIFSFPAQGGLVREDLSPRRGETDFHEISALPGNRGLFLVLHDSTGYGKIDIWTGDSTRVRVLSSPSNLSSPVYAAPGYLVFERFGDSQGIWAAAFSLETLQITGEPFLVAENGKSPNVAADGTLVYTLGQTNLTADLVRVDREGRVTQAFPLADRVVRPFPNLSPDGRYVLHASTDRDSREVYLYDLETKNRRRLTFNEDLEGMASFHPNGKEFFFYKEPAWSLYRQDLTSGAAEELVVPGGLMATVTSDGQDLIFARALEEQFAFEIARKRLADPSQPAEVLVSTGAIDWWPQVSQDLRYLAYDSNESGHEQVYVTTYPTPGNRWQITREGGMFPRWRGDGKELYYTTRDAIYAVEINAEGGFAFSEPRMLFKRPHIDWSSRWADGYDVTRDGQHFYLFAPAGDSEGTQASIVVVHNWAAEYATP